jgi:hypothetical protein
MSNYLECEKQAKAIGQRFHELLKKSGSQEKFCLEYPDLTVYKINEPILIIGLNPSGEDDVSKGRTYPNLFSYIPQLHSNDEGLALMYKELSKFSYIPYFKTFTNAFQNLNPQYNPLWYNPKVLQEIIKEPEQALSTNLNVFFNPYTSNDNGNYIIFADLIQYSKTNSKVIIEHLKDETVIPLLKRYFITMLDFIKPKLVLVANAAASHFIVQHFNDEVATTTFNLNGYQVFLGSMLTGQRAMDVFSRQRMMNEIQQYINEK